MKRILEVNVDDKGYGGVFSYVKNVVKNIDKEKISINVCCFETFENDENKSFIKEFGGDVYDCSSDGNFFVKQIKSCVQFMNVLKKERFNIIHIHSDVAYKLLLYGMVAKYAGMRKIIVHSHSSGIEGQYRWLKKILQPIAKILLAKTDFIKVACSLKAAEWMYNNEQANNVVILNNGIELKKFKYDKATYISLREKMGLQNKRVIGTVARFSYQKYPEKLLNVFKKLLTVNENYVLLWVGSGELRENIIKKSKEYGIYENIIFYGNTNRVQDLYQVMDVFVLTSRFEGLCISAVEAQAAGLPCLCSAEMSPETKLYDGYYSVSVEESDEIWANYLNDIAKKDRVDTYSLLKKQGYDLYDSVKNVEELYYGE